MVASMRLGKRKKPLPTSETAEPAAHTPFPPQFFRPKAYGIVLVATVIAVTGMALVSIAASLDLERDMRNWQDRLNLIADSRAGAVSEWVDGNFQELKKLSENPSLQLYFTELSEEKNVRGEDPAQKTYLRNLLIFTADRMGFSPQSMPMSVKIPAQINYSAASGIAVLNTQGEMVVSTPYFSKLEPHVAEQLKNLPAGASALIDMYKNEEGKAQFGFVVPVFGIQADPENTQPIGRIIGVREAGDALFKLLRHPGVTERTMEIMLLRAEGDRVTYLSPVGASGAPLEKTLNTPPAERFALNQPGAFGEQRDYQSHPVLVTGRAIANTPWKLMVKVDSSEALKDSHQRRNWMIATLLLVLAAVLATVIAVWHNASSRRALFASRYFRDLAERATAQERLLALVADNQPEAVYIVDQDHRYRFANQQAAFEAGMPSTGAMIGKLTAEVLGAWHAQDITAASDEARMHGPHAAVRRFSRDGHEHVVQTAYVPLTHIPVPGLPEPTPGVLIVDQDISEVVHEREKRLRIQRELIDTLIMLVDKRDPSAAHHSMAVARIAQNVALLLALPEHTVETTRIAGSLMNIGKIVVPEEVLVRPNVLSESELRFVRDSMKMSADILRHISFEGPVVETLEQAQEHWDGSGPQGLKGEGIMIGARIIAVANMFVGIISPRAYRTVPMGVPQALDLLLSKVDKQFDRRVVVALAHYIENQGGNALLTASEPPQAA